MFGTVKSMLRTERIKKIFDATARALLGLILVFFALEAATTVILAGYNIFTGGYSDPRIGLDVYEGKEWAKELFVENSQVEANYSAYVDFKMKPYKGKYINIDDKSLRSTLNPCATTSPVRVFVFGGSAMWGVGARDGQTIASQLSKKLCDKGINAEVTNFAQVGYVSTQEIVQLELELKKGNVPDYTVFYDGVNDIAAAVQNKEAGFPQNIANREAEFNSRNRFNIARPLLYSNFARTTLNIFYGLKDYFFQKKLEDGYKFGDPDELGGKVAADYASNIGLVDSLSQKYRFKAFHFWQPTVFSKKNTTESEKRHIQKDIVLKPAFDSAYSKIKAIENGRFFDVSGAFDSSNESVFIDFSHISEEGNGIIAGKMAEVIAQEIEK